MSVQRVLDDPFPAYREPVSKTQQLRAKKVAQEQAKSQDTFLPTSVPPLAPPRQRVTHYVMNLPDSAITFLGAFRGLLSPSNAGGRDLSGVYGDSFMPMVHCYCFTREAELDQAEIDIRQVGLRTINPANLIIKLMHLFSE